MKTKQLLLALSIAALSACSSTEDKAASKEPEVKEEQPVDQAETQASEVTHEGTTVIAGQSVKNGGLVKSGSSKYLPKEDDVEEVKQELKTMKQQIMDLIKTESCETVADCGLIAVGHRPCGGPESYQAYAKRSTDEKALKGLVNKYTRLQTDFQRENKIVGICSMIEEPDLACQANKCVATTAGSAL